jgi:mitotic spindle assembly checkpoint protein MAD1
LPTSTSRGAKASDTLVPKASLHALQLALQEKDQQLASKEKSAKRLRDIFAAKAHEFREAVFSLLGWKLEFQPNGRVKATSMFHPGPKSKKKTGDDGEEEDEGNFIVFDGENATMKISGGVKSAFAAEIKTHVDFWVEGNGQVPCMLAAMTIDFFEKYHGK